MITDWQARPVPEAMSDEKLAALIDREVEAADRMLFTVTPREELDAIGRSQQLADQAFAQQVRLIVGAHARSGVAEREFAVDEIALALGVGSGTAARVLAQALALAALPGLVEAIEAGMLTLRHALAVLRTLDAVPELSAEHRRAIVLIVLARLSGQTPGELAKLTHRLILTIDLRAAQARQDAASRERRVSTYPDVDGQAVVHARGPLAQVAAIKASISSWLRDHPKAADDPRSEAEREFDLFVALLTGAEQPGQWQTQIIVPFSAAAGGDLELAEIPGFGPILPSTARDLATDTAWTQVAVDQDGVVIATGDPIKAPKPPKAPVPAQRQQPTAAEPTAAEPVAATSGPASGDTTKPSPVRDELWWTAMRQLISQPPTQRLRPDHLSSAAYRTPDRLKRYLQARDRTCVFPGCHRRITDIDHRIPWPLGPTSAANLQLLCRHHHRAKQAVFTVELTPDGDYLWTTRGGWQFLRHRQGY